MIVSIIMPTYNAASNVAESIESILAQTLSDWELIISDDCSTDETVNIVNGYTEQFDNIKLITSNKNQGSAIARNTAVDESSGRYIAFLDADDLWLPNKLERQLNFMIKFDIGLSNTSYQKFDASGNRGVVRSCEKVNYTDLLKSNSIGCLTVMYDTQKIGKNHMPNLRRKQDYALWLELLRNKVEHCYGLDEVLAKYRSQGGNTSNKTRAFKEQWFFYRHYLGLGVCNSIYFFSYYAFSGLLKFIK